MILYQRDDDLHRAVAGLRGRRARIERSDGPIGAVERRVYRLHHDLGGLRAVRTRTQEAEQDGFKFHPIFDDALHVSAAASSARSYEWSEAKSGKRRPRRQRG